MEGGREEELYVLESRKNVCAHAHISILQRGKKFGLSISAEPSPSLAAGDVPTLAD